MRRSVLVRLRSLTARVHPAPVIILGKEKSGTSAIAALLGELTGCETTIDIPPLWGAPEVAFQNGNGDFRKFVDRHRWYFSKPIIKEPGLTFFYPLLREVFPNARFVVIVRDPRDGIRSVCNRLGIPGDLPELTAEHRDRLPDVWKLVFDPAVNRVPGENYIGSQAGRWNLATDVHLQHPDETLFVRYEDFQRDKRTFLEELATKLDLRPVRDISERLEVPFQPEGNRAADPLAFFGSGNLATIERICGERMNKSGYHKSPVSGAAR